MILENSLGDKFYYKFDNGPLHREDGPAIIWSYGYEEWYIDGKLHREDGPAVYGDDCKEWWIDGVRLSKEKEAIMNIWWNNKNGRA